MQLNAHVEMETTFVSKNNIYNVQVRSLSSHHGEDPSALRWNLLLLLQGILQTHLSGKNIVIWKIIIVYLENLKY